MSLRIKSYLYRLCCRFLNLSRYSWLYSFWSILLVQQICWDKSQTICFTNNWFYNKTLYILFTNSWQRRIFILAVFFTLSSELLYIYCRLERSSWCNCREFIIVSSITIIGIESEQSIVFIYNMLKQDYFDYICLINLFLYKIFDIIYNLLSVAIFNITTIYLSLLSINIVFIIDLLADALLYKRLFESIIYILLFFLDISLIVLQLQLVFNNKDKRFSRIILNKLILFRETESYNRVQNSD